MHLSLPNQLQRVESSGKLSGRGSVASELISDNHSFKSYGRLINKDGSYDVQHAGLPKTSKKRLRNAFHVLLEIKWRYVVLSIFILFPLSWTIFAIMFYIVAYLHGDFRGNVPLSYNNQLLTPYKNASETTENTKEPCIQNVNGFLGMILFSIESQETIGYGHRYNTEECYSLLILLSLQYVFGGVLQACLCAVIWARLLRPKSRGQEVIFSKTACISLDENGNFRLKFRVSDINGTHLVQSGVRLYLAKKNRVPGVKMGEDTGRDKVFFLWPTVPYHVIDQNSLLYNYSREEFEKSDFEFIAIAEGIVESTGLTVQTRTSYLSSEVQWGYRYKPMNFGEKGRKSRVKINYDDFDNTYKVETPECSPRDWHNIRKQKSGINDGARQAALAKFSASCDISECCSFIDMNMD